MDGTENTSANSPIVACLTVEAITYERPLFTESLQWNGCCIATYFAVAAQQGGSYATMYTDLEASDIAVLSILAEW
jgi:hypothetical protein